MWYFCIALSLRLDVVHGTIPSLLSFYAVNHTHPKANLLANTVECSEPREKFDVCAENCFEKEKSGEGCVGFICHSNGTCELCQPKEFLNTEISTDDTLYVLRNQIKHPDVHFTMDSFDSNHRFKNGKVATVETHSTVAGQEGKKNKAIHFNSQGVLKVSVTDPDCFCNFRYCPTTGITLSFWMKAFQFNDGQIITSASQGLTLGTCFCTSNLLLNSLENLLLY